MILLSPLKYATLVLAMIILPGPTANAKECDLSLQTGLVNSCPANAVGPATTNPDYTGATVDPDTYGLAAVDAFGYCRFAGNKDKTPIFLPFGEADEWRAYMTNHPASVELIQCVRGGKMVVPPNFGADRASNQCATMPPLQSVETPYRPANAPGEFTTPPVTYLCRSADGTEFSESVTATLTPHDSGFGPGNDLGWTFGKVLYTYDAQCGAAKGVASPAAPTTGLCSVGTPSAVIGIGPYTWVCSSGNGGGKNKTCSTGTTCEITKVEEKPCRCEDKKCYRAITWADSCGHSWLDKSKVCDTPEPQFNPQGPIDYDNDFRTK